MKKFSFYLKNKDVPEKQVLIFKEDGENAIEIEIPNKTFSEDVTQAFYEQYAILIENGLVSPDVPVFNRNE